jgi:hypothetical protein
MFETTTIKVNGVNFPAAKIRQDLLEEELSVPVGDGHYGSKEPVAYRWKNLGQDNEQFQVHLNGEWQDAESIDFDFL